MSKSYNKQLKATINEKLAKTRIRAQTKIINKLLKLAKL